MESPNSDDDPTETARTDGVGSEANWFRQQGINNPEAYTISLCLQQINTTKNCDFIGMEIQQEPA
jgi:hypothetical protein